MNTVAWVLQVIVAFLFGMGGVMKFAQPREKLVNRMAWVYDFSATQVKLIGILEFLAAIGLILPAVTGILTWLTPLAAVGLVLTMLGGGYTHFRRKEYAEITLNVILLALAATVAYIRFFVETL